MQHHSSIKSRNILYGISIISFFSALHLAIPNYFNSSVLATFLDEKMISLVYLAISAVTIAGLLLMNTILNRFGNLRTSLALILIQMFVFYRLTVVTDPASILPLFIIGMSMISLIIFTIDIFIQKNTEVEHTGSVRGLTMTATNTAWVIGPLVGGMLVVAGGDSIESYRGVYIAGFALLLPLLYLIYRNFHNFKDPKYIHVSAIQTVSRVLKDRDISRIFVINIVLQTFYVWMTIYFPIYLHNVMYFNWGDISLIFTIMLIPFVILDIPLGKLADMKWGEKEMMAVGFAILGISTASLVLLDSPNILLWSSLLFVTRIGAATVEIMIETYFFKKVDGKDPEVLSIFRITRSLSFFIAPLVVTLSLVYVTEKYLFVVFGVICLLTLYPILTIKDTN